MSGLDMLQDTFIDDLQLRRAHPVRRFVLRSLLIIVLIAGGGAVALWRYQPLTSGDTFGARGDQVRATQSLGGTNVVTYAGSEYFEMTLAVRNTGLVSIKVLAVPNSAPGPLISSYGVSVMPRNATAYDDDKAGSFRPFALRPGESRVLRLSYVFANCGEAAPDSNFALRRQRVRYQLASRLERVAEFALTQPVVITGVPPC